MWAPQGRGGWLGPGCGIFNCDPFFRKKFSGRILIKNEKRKTDHDHAIIFSWDVHFSNSKAKLDHCAPEGNC
jgi:hypothetical protein